MAGIDETIVREYFEINGFLVRQMHKYQVQSRKKRADEEIDLVVYNPLAPAEKEIETSFVLAVADLKKIRNAVVEVRGWHTSTFSEATLSCAQIFNFLQKSAIKRVEGIFGDDGKIFKILALPSLPKNTQERKKSIDFLKGKGIDAVLTYPHMLRLIADKVEVNNNYVKSDILQIMRILKNYNMLRPPQMDFFEK